MGIISSKHLFEYFGDFTIIQCLWKSYLKSWKSWNLSNFETLEIILKKPTEFRRMKNWNYCWKS
jgi:hypothetical protein